MRGLLIASLTILTLSGCELRQDMVGSASCSGFPDVETHNLPVRCGPQAASPYASR
ncbi:hypothetical protein AQS8620_02790 [Aquimixticola soesokkakensis]|uniref:Lipoprotein n=1 Tax=Aquimixticola soesokkakensis TaxID=1519096 RepID=A0A1Y5TDM6_9RHOB|nr:hypothetical protein AQS8620_02790 [Aquimixticola soesokkakensis]